MEWNSLAILPSAVLGNSLYLIWENVLLHFFQANKVSLPAVLAQMSSSYVAGFIATSIMSELSGKEADGAHAVFFSWNSLFLPAGFCMKPSYEELLLLLNPSIYKADQEMLYKVPFEKLELPYSGASF